MPLSDFSIVVRSLRARSFSSITTALGVALAVALMLVLLMMRSAASDSFSRGSGNMHLLISADASPLSSVLNGVFYASPPKRALTNARALELIADLPLGDNGFAIPTHQGDSYQGQPVLDTTPDFFTRFQPVPGQPWRFAGGRAFAAPFEVVLGAKAAQRTGLRIGDHIHLAHGTSSDDHDHEHDDFSFDVVGILAPTGSPHDRALFTSLESTWIIHAHDRRERESGHGVETTAADLLDSDKLITGLYVRLATRANSDVTSAFQSTFDRLRRDPAITIASPADEMRTLMALVSNIDRILLAMAAAVMLSNAVSIMLALYNSMDQRRRQIAVLRVLGASRARIFGLILTEAAIIGLLGAAIGALLSLAGAQAVAAILQHELGLWISPGVPARPTVAILLATLALSAVAGVIPAIMAYRTSVAKNLKPAA